MMSLSMTPNLSTTMSPPSMMMTSDDPELDSMGFLINWTHQTYSLTTSSSSPPSFSINNPHDHHGHSNYSSSMGDSGGASSGGESEDPSILPHLKWVVGGVFTPIFCVLGMVGNVLAVITWSRPALRSSTGRFLTAQSLADFGVLFTWILVTSAKQWFPSLGKDQVYTTFFSYIAMPLHFFSLHCSVWFTLAITIERYIMVCWATHAKRLCGMKQAVIGIVIILAFSTIDNIPHFIYGVTRDSKASDVINLPAIKLEGADADKRSKIYGLYFFCVSLIAMPWFFVLFFNYKIVSAIITSNRRMLDKKSEEASIKAKKAEWQITRLLLAVSFTYLATMGPFCLLQIALILDSGIDRGHRKVAVNITVAGHVINSSLNFVLYCMMGRRFRRELKTMLGIKLSDSDMSTQYTTSSEAGSRSADTNMSKKT